MEAQVERPTVTIGRTVVKSYPHTIRDRWDREVFAYTSLPEFTPRLLDYRPGWLEIERLTPVTSLAPHDSVRFRRPLRRLLERLHNAGWWHCDVSLVNVVIDWERGPLLIDWENLRRSEGDVSYDLHGARRAGVEVEYAPHAPDGIWWGADGACPRNFWRSEC